MNRQREPKLHPRRVLMIVENLPVPFDRRVWAEATTLRGAGYLVSVICPKGRGFDASEEVIDDIYIYRHPLPIEARGAAAYFVEYPLSLLWQFVLSIKVAHQRGFDVIHACNPPDLIFIVGWFYKIFANKSFLFDHHDANPEFYEAKFGRRGLLWRILLVAEWLTFRTADVSIATNESYRQIAIERGRMREDRVFTVRSGPNLDRVKKRPVDPVWRRGRQFVVSYVGVIGQTEGLDLLLTAIDHIVRTKGRSDIQFVIVGSGPELPATIVSCSVMGLDQFVTFTGSIDDPTLFTILSTSDVCVNPDRPSTFNNISTMNKIMEYMALGKPIVQFDTIEGRASAEHASVYAAPNDCADFGDKILDLIDDPHRRDVMGNLGDRRVKDSLAWAHQQPNLLKAYDTVFNIRERRRASGSN